MTPSFTKQGNNKHQALASSTQLLLKKMQQSKQKFKLASSSQVQAATSPSTVPLAAAPSSTLASLSSSDLPSTTIESSSESILPDTGGGTGGGGSSAAINTNNHNRQTKRISRDNVIRSFKAASNDCDAYDSAKIAAMVASAANVLKRNLHNRNAIYVNQQQQKQQLQQQQQQHYQSIDVYPNHSSSSASSSSSSSSSYGNLSSSSSSSAAASSSTVGAISTASAFGGHRRTRTNPRLSHAPNDNRPDDASLTVMDTATTTATLMEIFHAPSTPTTTPRAATTSSSTTTTTSNESNDYQSMLTDDVRREFGSDCTRLLLTNPYASPHLFLRLPTQPSPIESSNSGRNNVGIGNGHGMAVLDLKVNAHRLHKYMVNYMNQYYDLSTDTDAFSSARQQMDDYLWDMIAYLIPLLCRQVVDDSLCHEPLIVSCVGGNSLVFGDIHGNLNDIHYIYKNFLSNPRYERYRFIFLGDYVDRGPKSIEVVTFLLLCKLIEPNRYILLRGNHEVAKVNKKYGFKALVDHIFEDTFVEIQHVVPTFVYASFNRVFNHLPVAAVLRATEGARGVFCCHGGVPSQYLKNGLGGGDSNTNSHTRLSHGPWTITELNNLGRHYGLKPHNLCPSKRAPPTHLALNEILWNDPIPKKVLHKEQKKLASLRRHNKHDHGHGHHGHHGHGHGHGHGHHRRHSKGRSTPNTGVKSVPSTTSTSSSSSPSVSLKLFYKNHKRGGHCSWFTKDALNYFCDVNHLKLIIRGHQYRKTRDTGFRFDFDNHLLTVFSSSNYCGSQSNVTGYVAVISTSSSDAANSADNDNRVEAHILRPIAESRRFADFNVFHYRVDERTREIKDIVF